MIDYRTFRNWDPPQLLQLWNRSGLGRGAATGISLDLLELLLFCHPYFDSRGLVLACLDKTVIGMAHAGFGCLENQTDLCRTDGVICQVIVDPDHRRQGIGRELVDRAQRYLISSGATRIHAGSGPGRDPFYCGLYGGSEAAGFLSSETGVAEFLDTCGFQPEATFGIFQKQLTRESVQEIDYQSIQWMRSVKLKISPQRQGSSWWWNNRMGRLDYIRFRLERIEDHKSLASLTLVGLDQYQQKWRARGVGLVDIHVEESVRREGLGKHLLGETLRRLKQESISLVEAHAADDDPALTALLTSSGFERIDTGTQFQARQLD